MGPAKSSDSSGLGTNTPPAVNAPRLGHRCESSRRAGVAATTPVKVNCESGEPAIAGVVKSVGAEVKQFAVGDRVMALVSTGGFAEECVADAARTLPLPQGMDFDTGAALMLTYCTSLHALKDKELPRRLAAFIASGKPAIVTDGLAQRLEGAVDLKAPLVRVLPVRGDPASLLALPQAEIDALRAPALTALGRTFGAPARVALYLFADGSYVVENFNDTDTTVDLDGAPLTVPARNWRWSWK